MARCSAYSLMGICCAMVVAWSLIGCSDRSGGAARSYTVRGEIVQLPGAQSVDQAMLIRHEAIPTFADASGKVVGMMSMTMPFPVAKGVSIEGLKAGDAVSFTFEMNWSAPKGDNPYQVVKIAKLPADTKLEFGETMPQMPGGAGDEHAGHQMH